MRHEDKSQTNFALLALLVPFIKPYYKRALLILMFLPLGSLAYSIQPTIIQKAIDGPISSFAHYHSLSAFLSALYPYIFALLAAIALNFYVQINMLYSINDLGQHMVADIRTKLFQHLESLPMTFFDRTPVGRNVTRITNDMEQLADSFAGGLILIVVDIVNAIGVIAFMSYLNLRLSLAVLFLLLPMYFIAKHFQEQFRKANLLARSELSRLNSFLQQAVIGVDVVQALNAGKQSMSKFAAINKQYYKANDDSIKADASFSATIELVAIAAVALLIFLSKEILMSGTLISVGVIIAFLQYAQTLFDPIRNLCDRFSIIQAGFTAAERVSQLLSEEESIREPESPQSLTELARIHGRDFPAIEFRNIYFRYSEDTDWILENFNLTIKASERVALVGRTGSGKSSIVKLLTRLYEPQRGEILINGVNICNFPQEELRAFVAVIHQDSYIFAGDLKSNILLDRDHCDLDLAKPYIQILSERAIELDTSLEQRATNISSGEEQLINFARAIVSRPKILVLDEATAKIDLKTEKILLEALSEYRQIEQCSVLAVAHRTETLSDFDKIINISEDS